MELGNIELEILKTNKEKEILEVKCPKKIYYLKAESKNVFNSWFNKLTIQVNMIKQNIYISEFETKIAKNESSLGLKLVSSILGSFNNIENIFTNSLLKQWFFQFIQEISPEEAGLLLLLEFYIKFKKELKAENYKEAFKNCNRIYEIIRKVSEDWERKCFPLDQEPEEIKVKSNSFKRNTRNSIIKSPTKMFIINHFNNLFKIYLEI